MNTLQKSLIALAAGSLLSVSAQAAIYGGASTGQPYVGIKVGQMNVDVNNSEKPTAYGVYAGYNFDPNFGAEVEYLAGQDAKFDYNVGGSNVKGDVTSKTYGAYGTYRYYLPNTNFYGKGKLGIAKADIEAKAKLDGNRLYSAEAGSGAKLAGGVGVGFAPTPNVGIEAEYAKTGDAADAITLGAHLKF